MKQLRWLKRKFKRYRHKRHMMIKHRQMMSFAILELNIIFFFYLLAMWLFLDVQFPLCNMGMAIVSYPYWRLDCNYHKYRLKTQRIIANLQHNASNSSK